MPEINADGCTIHVEVEGPQNGPVLMLSNSLGTNMHMWDDQVPAFTRHFRVVRFDRRGHGKSAVPKGPYSIERLGRDALAVLDALGIAQGQLVRSFHGGNGRPMAWRQRRKPYRQTRPLQHCELFS